MEVVNGTILVIGDLHIPFCDIRALLLILNYSKKIVIKTIIIIGDYQDLYSISKFESEKCREDDLEYELMQGREVLELIRKFFPTIDIIFMKGNHESRLESFLSKGKNKSLFNLSCLKIDNLLNFEKYNIKLHEPHILKIAPDYMLTHGTRCGVNAAQSEALSFMCNGASAHVHKTLYFYRNFLNFYIEWNSIGHCALTEKMKYANGFNHSWNQGFLFLHKNDNIITSENYAIHDYKIISRGKTYENK
jgi:predicted phosphodiesterase